MLVLLQNFIIDAHGCEGVSGQALYVTQIGRKCSIRCGNMQWRCLWEYEEW